VPEGFYEGEIEYNTRFDILEGCSTDVIVEGLPLSTTGIIKIYFVSFFFNCTKIFQRRAAFCRLFTFMKPPRDNVYHPYKL